MKSVDISGLPESNNYFKVSKLSFEIASKT